MRKGSRSRERGTTLIESMAAMLVVIVGFLGVMAVNKIGVKMNGDARTVTRASAIANDLVEQLGLLSYADARLAPGTHGEADVTLGNTVHWGGIPTPVVQDGVPLPRSWTVTRVDDVDGNGIWDGARVAVTVGSVTLYTYKKNPAEK